MITKDLGLGSALAAGVAGANVTQLKDTTKQQALTINGASSLRQAFKPGSPGYEIIDKLLNQTVEEVYAGIRDMSPEQLRQNSRYQAAAEAYYNTHLNIDPSATTPQQQKQEYQLALTAMAQSYNALTRGNGAVMFDAYGEPRYYRIGLNGKLEDATNAGVSVELFDADAVNARDYLLADARRVVELAGTRIEDRNEAIKMWNEAMQRTMPIANKSTQTAAETVLRGAPLGFEPPVQAAIDVFMRLLSNGVYDDRTKGVVVPVNEMVCPISGKITNTSKNNSTGLERVEVTEDDTGNVVTFIGQSLINSMGDIGTILHGTEPIRTTGENIGITVKSPEGKRLDPRTALIKQPTTTA